MPRTMTVVGAGVIGVEYASIFAALGTRRYTLVDQRPLRFADAEIAEALQYLLRRRGVTFRFGEAVTEVDPARSPRPSPRWRRASASPSDMVLYAIGRQGVHRPSRTSTAPGLDTDKRGRIQADSCGRTGPCRIIYAVGDVGWRDGPRSNGF